MSRVSRAALGVTVALALAAIAASVMLVPSGSRPQVVELEPVQAETVPLPTQAPPARVAAPAARVAPAAPSVIESAPLIPAVRSGVVSSPAPAAPTAGPPALPLQRGPSGVAVQAGAFLVRGYADRLAAKLTAAGFPARVESAGGRMLRVVTGPYADETAARAAAQTIAPLAR